ncbi:MAG TPA: hypothetical protein VEB65_03655, partial [Solirubrobacterales bacterium]|nr:hypothetical protein [Solirubrobacterales bacterium]
RTVSPVPHGSHPAGLFAPPPFGEYAYADDYPFIAESTDAHRLDDSSLAEWVQTRLLATPAPATIDHLRDWRHPAPAPAADLDLEPTPEETMAASAGRLLAEIAAGEERPEFVLTGIGVSSLAAWLARDLASAFPPLISEVGLYDYVPEPGNPFLFNFPNLASVAGLTDTETILGILVQGHGSSSLGVLAAGQLDRNGSINSTRTERGWITGSGGANDIASGTRRNVALVLHRPGRLVAEVDFVTSPGHHVAAIVTDRAVLERRDGEFVLAGVVAAQGEDLEQVVRDVVAATPWPIPVVRTVRRIAPPNGEERRILRGYDPEGFILGSGSVATKHP